MPHRRRRACIEEQKETIKSKAMNQRGFKIKNATDFLFYLEVMLPSCGSPQRVWARGLFGVTRPNLSLSLYFAKGQRHRQHCHRSPATFRFQTNVAFLPFIPPNHHSLLRDVVSPGGASEIHTNVRNKYAEYSFVSVFPELNLLRFQTRQIFVSLNLRFTSALNESSELY